LKGADMNNDLAQFFGGVPFTPATIEPTTDFPVIPPGKYPVLIEAAEVKLTKKGTGHYVKLTMSILDGPHKNQKIWDQINIQNPSTECVEIGLRTLSALGRALGLQTITDTTQLVNQVVVAHVKVQGEQNSVRTYSAPVQQTAPVDAANSPETYAAPDAKQASESKPPWER